MSGSGILFPVSAGGTTGQGISNPGGFSGPSVTTS